MSTIRRTAFRLLSSWLRPAPAKPSIAVAAARARPAEAAMPELAATIAAALGTPEAAPKPRPCSTGGSVARG